MFKTLTKLHKSKSGRFIDFPRSLTIGNTVFIIVIALVITYIVNFFLNQFFGTKLLPLGQPLRFLIIGLALISSFYVISRRQGDLDRQAIFSILLIAGASFALFYYLPVLIPEIFTNPQSNSIYSLLNSAYTNPDSPIAIWYNVSQSVHSGVQSVVPIP